MKKNSVAKQVEDTIDTYNSFFKEIEEKSRSYISLNRETTNQKEMKPLRMQLFQLRELLSFLTDKGDDNKDPDHINNAKKLATNIEKTKKTILDKVVVATIKKGLEINEQIYDLAKEHNKEMDFDFLKNSTDYNTIKSKMLFYKIDDIEKRYNKYGSRRKIQRMFGIESNTSRKFLEEIKKIRESPVTEAEKLKATMEKYDDYMTENPGTRLNRILKEMVEEKLTFIAPEPNVLRRRPAVSRLDRGIS